MSKTVLFRKPNCAACDALVKVMNEYRIPYIDQPIGTLKADDKDYTDLLPILFIEEVGLVENVMESSVLTNLMLQHNKINLTYTKKNGEQREAVATLNEEFIPEDHRSSSPIDYTNHQVRYYDLSVGAWRSFIHDNLVMMTRL